jgi:hypothetical protein
MTILSNFVSQNYARLGADLADRLAIVAAMGMVVGITIYSPVMKATTSTEPEIKTGKEVAAILGAHAARIEDRLADMGIIQQALHENIHLQTTGKSAAITLSNLANHLRSDTPHPELAERDLERLNAPENISSLKGAADSLNQQKAILSEASSALQDIFHTIGHGGFGLERDISRLDRAISRYEGIRPEVTATLRDSLERLREEPCVPDITP